MLAAAYVLAGAFVVLLCGATALPWLLVFAKGSLGAPAPAAVAPAVAAE